MALTLHDDIDNFRKKSLECSIIRELEDINDNDDELFVDRKTKLNTLLDEINEKSKTKTDTTQELKDMFETIEKQMHMQPWNKLQEGYKIEKIKEYCVTNSIPNDISEKVVDMAKEKYLTSKYIDYNQHEQKINSISLIIKNPEDKYCLDDEKIRKIIKQQTETKKKSSASKNNTFASLIKPNTLIKPSANTAKPIVNAIKPSVTTTKPTVNTTKPSVTTTKPAINTTKPTVTTTKPNLSKRVTK